MTDKNTVASASSARIVFLDRETLPPEVSLRAPRFPHEIVLFGSTRVDEIVERVADADIVITNKVPLRRDVLEKVDRLRLIAIAATGYDIIDLAACRDRGVGVANIRNYAVKTVPEHTFALMMALRRNIPGYLGSVADGAWQRSGQFCYFERPIHDLAGSTLGIIGDGALGRSVARLGEAFGMRVLFSSYKGVSGMGPLYTPFEQVLRESDVITLHCPLLESTRNMIGQPEFDVMERRPLIINTARGGLVDEAALVDALRSGKIAGAGFDVVTEEPPAADHPFMLVLGHPNFILTPHTAWGSLEAIQSLADQLVDNIEAFWEGAPRNLLSLPA